MNNSDKHCKLISALSICAFLFSLSLLSLFLLIDGHCVKWSGKHSEYFRTKTSGSQNCGNKNHLNKGCFSESGKKHKESSSQWTMTWPNFRIIDCLESMKRVPRTLSINVRLKIHKINLSLSLSLGTWLNFRLYLIYDALVFIIIQEICACLIYSHGKASAEQLADKF